VSAATSGSGRAIAAALEPIMPARCQNVIIRLHDVPGGLVHRQKSAILGSYVGDGRYD
jgi:hypothetical protein